MDGPGGGWADKAVAVVLKNEDSFCFFKFNVFTFTPLQPVRILRSWDMFRLLYFQSGLA